MRLVVTLLGVAGGLWAQTYNGTPYEVRDGWAVTRGDILLGRAVEIEAAPAEGRAAAATPPEQVRWTNGTMYYTIDPDVPNPDRILAAIEHWNTRSPLRIEPHTGQSNRVRFVRSTGVCSSFVGMRGGEQPINVIDSCATGSLIHEIGHAFGLLHEQERADRNTWVTVLTQNIEPRYIYAFEPDSRGVLDLYYYDYDSIMQYPSTAFSRNVNDTIETVPPGIPIGQRGGLSAGDIDAVSRLYGIVPAQTTIATIPAGLTIRVDGESYTAPRSFDWPAGSTHTIAVEPRIGTDPQYRYVRWSDGGELSHSITASAGRTVFAAVFQAMRPVTIRRGTGNGTVVLAPLSEDGYYPERLPLRLTATPAAGQMFFSWSGRPNVSSAGQGFASEIANVQVGASSGDIVGNFALPPLITIDSQPRGMQILADGVPYRTPVRLQWSAGSTHTLGAINPQSRDAGMALWSFDAWSDGGPISHEVTAPAAGAAYTARFTARYQLGITAEGGGSVTQTPSSPDGFYSEGTEVRLIPVGTTSTTHLYWTGDLAGRGERTIAMDSPKTILATFGTEMPVSTYNAASFTLNPDAGSTRAAIAPGEIVTLFSDNSIGPPALVTAQVLGNKFTTELGGTRVLFNGVAAPLVYAAEHQVSAIVPWNVTTPVTISAQRNNQPVAEQLIFVRPAFPALFTANASGKGQVAALNGDLTINSPSNPVEAGGVIVLYATGSGELGAAVEDGAIADGNLIGVKAPVMVRIGKLPAQVIYAGSAPGIVQGAFQVNATVPKEALADPATPIQLIVGTFASPPGTTIAIR